MKMLFMIIPYILIVGGNIGILVYVLTSINKIKKQQDEIIRKLNILIEMPSFDEKIVNDAK